MMKFTFGFVLGMIAVAWTGGAIASKVATNEYVKAAYCFQSPQLPFVGR